MKIKTQETNKANTVLAAAVDHVSTQKFEKDVAVVASLQSADEARTQVFDQATEVLTVSIDNMLTELGMKEEDSQNQRVAATYAALLSADNGVSNAEIDLAATPTMEEGTVISPIESGKTTKRHEKVAMLSYDSRDLEEVRQMSVAHNVSVLDRTPLEQALFETHILSPDELGLTVATTVMTLQRNQARSFQGNTENFQRVSYVDAIRDPSILNSDSTKLVPVYREESKHHFVDAAIVAPKSVLVDGQEVTTSWLKPGDEGNLISISQTDAMLGKGAHDIRDTIEPDARVKAVLVKVGDDIVAFDVSNMNGSTFLPAMNNADTEMLLNLSTNGVFMSKDTVQHNGDPLSTLAAVASNKLNISFRLQGSGTLDAETGNYDINFPRFKVETIYQEGTDEPLSLVSGIGKTVSDLVKAAEVIGFKALAKRSNRNIREKGREIHPLVYRTLYRIGLTAPYSVVRSTLDKASGQDLTYLTNLIKLDMSRECFDMLSQTEEQLKVFEKFSGNVPNGTALPEFFGFARHHIRPSIIEDDMDLLEAVDGISSSDREADLNAAIAMKIRLMATRVLKQSNLEAALVGEGYNDKITINVGTSTELRPYCAVNEYKSVSGQIFNMKSFGHPNKLLENKIYFWFSVNGKGPRLGNFGTMLYKAEVVYNLTIDSNGSTSDFLIAQGCSRHIVDTAVLGVLNVSNVDEAISRLNKNTVIEQAPAGG